MRNKNFTNKLEYLTYRAAWKGEYKLIGEEIRELKRDIRNTSTPTWLQYSDLKDKKAVATYMLTELKMSKQKAQEQYLKEKEQVCECA